MTPDDIAKAREIIAEHQRCQFVGFAKAAFTGWPDALDEVERLQRIENTVCEQMGKLRAVALAAEKLTESEWCMRFPELKKAVKAWRES
jgi:hypothetical protein